MWIKLEDGRLTTTLYRKETDRNSFLLASSSHPSALKNGLPKSQFYRLRRICHSVEEFKENAIDMKQRFLARGYPIKSIEEAYNIALSTPRPHLLKKSDKFKDPPLFVSRRGPNLHNRELLTKQASTRNLRSQNGNRLRPPRTKLQTMGDRAFSSVAPRLWNSLPDHLRRRLLERVQVHGITMTSEVEWRL
ncbi:unnamed protein product [Leuciscus chuanchicus]